MKPASFRYYDPVTLDDALSILARVENARPLAGGQSLVPMMNFRLALPEDVIDLNGVSELAYLDIGPPVRIGAMCRQRDIEFSRELQTVCPLLREALLHVGHRQTRNRGTIGGSLCHADPASELPLVMLLHDSIMTLRSKKRLRHVGAEDFMLDLMTTSVEADELLIEVSFSPWPLSHGFAFEEYARRSGDFALASAGVLVQLNTIGSIERIAIAIGGVSNRPVRLKDLERSLVGETPSDDIMSAVAAATDEIEARADVHVSAEYRQKLASVLVVRAVKKAFKRALAGGNIHV